MLAYVEEVQRKELREGVAAVKHQAMAGSDMVTTTKKSSLVKMH